MHPIHLTVFISLLLCCRPSAAMPDSLQHQIGEVEIKARQIRQPLTESSEGHVYWNMAALENMPHVMGTADPLRCLQLLPGVATNNDYSTGIRIQGCSAAHTLLEMDGAPVFNSAHLLGLFSVFTPSHFRGMSLTKSKHDASFRNYLGGHLSFHSLDTLAQSIHLNATASFMESEGTLTLPTGNRSTLYLSARGSYLNLFYNNLLNMDDMKLDYGLQDYNLSYLICPDAHNKVQISLYRGQDKTEWLQKDFQSNCGIDWNNTLATVNWQHYGSRIMMQQHAHVSRYGNRVLMDISSVTLHQKSSILQGEYRMELAGTKGNIEWESGAGYSYTYVHPMQINVNGSFLQNARKAECETAHEITAFANVCIPLPNHLSLNGGMHLTCYSNSGHVYCYPDPRLTLRWQPRTGHTLSLHGGIYHQFLHQVTLSNGGLPVDFWTVSSAAIRPGTAYSTTVGYHFVSPRKRYEASVEIYYKHLLDQSEYYSSILDVMTTSSPTRQNIMSGNGQNYGIDCMIRRNTGRLTGWISYSLARSRRRFPELRQGRWYNAAYERRHDLSVVAEYKLWRHWSLGGNFIFASGTPYTKVNSVYLLNMDLITEYGKYNGGYLPPTHRLDLSLTYHLSPHKKAVQSLNLSFYNIYAHRNILFRYMGFEQEQYGYKFVYSLCRMLPSVGYSIKF